MTQYINNTRIKNRVGEIIGDIIVIKYNGDNKWECKCSCGKIIIKKSKHLYQSQSCIKCARIKKFGNPKDRKGKKFGRLTVIEHLGKNKYLCQCECNNKCIKSIPQLDQNASCGCWRREKCAKRCKNGFKRWDGKLSKTHGQAGPGYETETITYKRWLSMKTRCYRKTGDNYNNYGAKGITVSDLWKNSFETFLKDMGECPSNDYTLDRINNELGYFPGNCKWSTKKEQSANRKCTFKYDGIAAGILYDKYKPEISYSTFVARLRRGWNIKDSCKIVFTRI